MQRNRPEQRGEQGGVHPTCTQLTAASICDCAPCRFGLSTDSADAPFSKKPKVDEQVSPVAAQLTQQCSAHHSLLQTWGWTWHDRAWLQVAGLVAHKCPIFWSQLHGAL